MKSAAVRTSIDVPHSLHRQLHEVAARTGCSARSLILAGIEKVIEDTTPKRPRRRLNLAKPLVPAAGRKLPETNEQIYELIEFP